MPIRREHRHFYPIDWRQLSDLIRFKRAAGRCERCGRPHGATIVCLSDGRWYDGSAGFWRDDRGRPASAGAPIGGAARLTRVFLATAHVAHDTSRNGARDLAALCQRCHMLHDMAEHHRRRRLTLRLRRALGDLFHGPYPPA